MAYDPLNPNNEEEKDGAAPSAYAALMPGAPAVAPAGGAPTPAAPKAAATPGFVNFDRVMNANKSTVDRMRGEMMSTQQRQTDALNKGVQAAEKDLTGRAKTGYTAAAAPTALGADEAAINGVDVAGNAAATYSGPSKEDANSRYAPLLASYKAQQSAQVAPTGLDAQLLGKMDFSPGRQAAEDAYNASLGKTTAAVDAATKASSENQSRWGVLLGQHTAENEAAGERNRIEGETRARNAAANQEFHSKAIPEMGKYFGKDVSEKMGEVANDFSQAERNELSRLATGGEWQKFSLAFDQFYRSRGGNTQELTMSGAHSPNYNPNSRRR